MVKYEMFCCYFTCIDFSYRSHHKFLDDVLDGYIISASLIHFGMDGPEGSITRNKPSPLLHMRSLVAKSEWLNLQASEVCKMLTTSTGNAFFHNVQQVHQNIQGDEAEEAFLQNCKGQTSSLYTCPLCFKEYTSLILQESPNKSSQMEL